MCSKIIPYILAIVLYSIVVAFVFGRALFPGDGLLLFGDDIHGAYYFFRQFFNSFLQEGIWPWWNPYIFSGTPFIANPIVNIWYPPTWLFVFLPLNIAYSWHVALHILWAMVGMYVLLRFLLRPTSYIFHPDIAPWVGGLVFGLSGFFAARIWAGHVDVIAAASWMPWVFGAFWHLNNDRWKNLRHGGEISTSLNRRVVIAAVVLAMQLLAGYQTMAFFTAIAVFIVTLLLCYFVKSFKPLLFAGLAGLLGVGLAAIQIIPAQEFFRASIRTFDFPYSWNSYGSLTLQSLKQFFNPFIFGNQLTYSGPPPNYWEHAMFVGRVGLGLAIFGVFMAHKLRRTERLLPIGFVCIALFGLWVALGPNAPVDLQKILWTLIPPYHSLRIPPRHLILFVFGTSALAAFGLQLVKIHVVQMVMAAFVVVEMVGFARHFIELRPIPEARHDGELIRILKKDNEPYRMLSNFGMWIPPRDSFDFDASMSYRIFNATGYDPSILRSYYEYIDLANGNAPGSSILTHDVQVPYLNLFSQATDFLNIKYILVPRAYDPLYGVKTDRFVLLREDVTRDYRLYENKKVKPRFFFDNGTVMVKKYTPNEIVLSTDNKTGETLFSSEVFYPGWEGFIDGKKVDVIKTNHAFRALFVPAGRHTITYRYSPRIFLIGGFVTVAAVILCIGIFLKKQ